MYFRRIFNSLYGNRDNIIPYYWMPKWSGELVDPSARILNVYDKTAGDVDTEAESSTREVEGIDETKDSSKLENRNEPEYNGKAHNGKSHDDNKVEDSSETDDSSKVENTKDSGEVEGISELSQAEIIKDVMNKEILDNIEHDINLTRKEIKKEIDNNQLFSGTDAEDDYPRELNEL